MGLEKKCPTQRGSATCYLGPMTELAKMHEKEQLKTTGWLQAHSFFGPWLLLAKEDLTSHPNNTVSSVEKTHGPSLCKQLSRPGSPEGTGHSSEHFRHLCSRDSAGWSRLLRTPLERLTMLARVFLILAIFGTLNVPHRPVLKA